MKNKLYYQESGAVGVLGPILILVFGVVASLVLGGVYAYAITYIPFIYVNFFLTVFLGIGVGFVLNKAGLIGKIRNTKLMIVFGVLFGVIADYFGWVFWIHAASEQEILTFSFNEIILTMQELGEYGSWGIFGWTPTGFMLYAIWFIELAIIAFFAVSKAMETSSSLPFCENCEKWTKSSVVTSNLQGIPNFTQFITEIEKNNFNVLTDLEFVELDNFNRTKVELQKCESCDQDYYLTVKNITVKVDDDGKEDEDEDIVIENLIIDKKSFEMIKELKEEKV